MDLRASVGIASSPPTVGCGPAVAVPVPVPMPVPVAKPAGLVAAPLAGGRVPPLPAAAPPSSPPPDASWAIATNSRTKPANVTAMAASLLLSRSGPRSALGAAVRVAGRRREVRPGLWVLAALSLLFFVFYPYS